MFLVVDPLTHFYVFTETDPREDGFDGPVEQDVQLEEIGTLRDRSKDSTTSVPCLGRSPYNDKHYRVFESLKDCRGEGFSQVASVYGRYQSWHEFQENP